jgi:hypothetical protein
MAKRRMTSDASSAEDYGAASAHNGASPTSNKMEAVRQALKHLGKKSKPAEIHDFILREFHVDMKPNMISAYKSMIAKKKGKRGRPPGRKAHVETEAVAETTHRGPTGAAVSFKDIRVLKELSDRLGPNRIRELLELMGQ